MRSAFDPDQFCGLNAEARHRAGLQKLISTLLSILCGVKDFRCGKRGSDWWGWGCWRCQKRNQSASPIWQLSHIACLRPRLVVRGRGNNGNWQLNTSNIGGNLVARAISNAYYPGSDRGLGLTFQRGSIDIAEGVVQLLANEFYPDNADALFHRHSRPRSRLRSHLHSSSQLPRSSPAQQLPRQI